MKIKPNYLHEALEADKKDEARRSTNLRRASNEQSDTPNKTRENTSSVKNEIKFSDLLETAPKLQKTNQHHEDSRDDQRREEQKNEKKHLSREKDSASNVAAETRSEKYESSSNSGHSGGQNSFGANSGTNNLIINENFAARSILHIADLERLVSTIRSQIVSGGKREVVLQLRRSVLDGLRVKITTADGAKVEIEFLAQSEKARSQIEKHSTDLAEILRGRGINLQSLTTSLGSESGNSNTSQDQQTKLAELNIENNIDESSSSFTDNTFDTTETDGKLYQA